MQRVQTRTSSITVISENAGSGTSSASLPPGQIPNPLTHQDILAARSVDLLEDIEENTSLSRPSRQVAAHLPVPQALQRPTNPPPIDAPPAYFAEEQTVNMAAQEKPSGSRTSRFEGDKERASTSDLGTYRLAGDTPTNAQPSTSSTQRIAKTPLFTSVEAPKLAELAPVEREAAVAREAKRIQAQLRFDLFQLDPHHWQVDENYVRLTTYLKNLEFRPDSKADATPLLLVNAASEGDRRLDTPEIYLSASGFLLTAQHLATRKKYALAKPRVIADHPASMKDCLNEASLLGQSFRFEAVDIEAIKNRLAGIAQRMPTPVNLGLPICTSAQQLNLHFDNAPKYRPSGGLYIYEFSDQIATFFHDLGRSSLQKEEAALAARDRDFEHGSWSTEREARKGSRTEVQKRIARRSTLP